MSFESFTLYAIVYIFIGVFVSGVLSSVGFFRSKNKEENICDITTVIFIYPAILTFIIGRYISRFFVNIYVTRKSKRIKKTREVINK